MRYIAMNIFKKISRSHIFWQALRSQTFHQLDQHFQSIVISLISQLNTHDPLNHIIF